MPSNCFPITCVQGVVDSSDLPLNVSREILQESRDVRAIREGCAKRVLGLLEDMAANQEENYKTFWKAFGQCLKEGFGEDFANKDRLAKLARFVSTQSAGDEPDVSLEAYAARMKEGQDKIYVITADSLAAARNSPHLEIFKKKGIEVLLLTDRIDEWVLNFLTAFEEKPIQSVAKGSLDLSKVKDSSSDAETKKEEKAREEDQRAAKPAVEKAAKVLGEKVKEVRLSER